MAGGADEAGRDQAVGERVHGNGYGGRLEKDGGRPGASTRKGG